MNKRISRWLLVLSVLLLVNMPAVAQLNMRQVDQALRSDPHNLAALFQKARLLEQGGKLNDAIAVYQQIITLAPRRPEAYNNLGALYVKQGKLQQARQIIQKGMQTNTVYATMQQNLIRINREMAARSYASAMVDVERPVQLAQVDSINAGSSDKVLLANADDEQIRQEQERRKIAAEKAKQEEIARKKAEEEKRKQELLAQKKAAEEKRKQELLAQQQAKEQAEEQRRQEALARKQAAEEKRKQEALARKQAEEEKRRQEALVRKQAEEKRKQEALARKQAEEKRKQEELARRKAEEEKRQQALLAQKKAEEEKRQQALLAQKKAEEEQRQQALLAQKQAEDEQRQQALLAQKQAQQERQQAAEQQKQQLQDSVTRRVLAWSQAWSAQNVEAYVSFYVQGYQPNADMSHSAWVKQRQVRLSAPKWIKVKLESIQIQVVDENTVKVRFLQRYTSNTYQDAGYKQLTLVRVNGQWMIQDERAVR